MASSIKLLLSFQKSSYLAGIFPLESNENGPSIDIKKRIIIIFFTLINILTPAAFFVFDANSTFEHRLSLFATADAATSMCLYLIMIWQTENTRLFIENGEKFIGKRKDSISTYRGMVEKIERFCEFNRIAMAISIFWLTVPFFLFSLYNYFVLGLGDESFVLLFPVKWPFHWKTPSKYFVVWSIQSVGIGLQTLTFISLVNLVVGSCGFLIVMAEDIVKDLVTFTHDTTLSENQTKWKERFCDIICLFSDAKQCVDKFNACVSYLLFVLISFIMTSETSLVLMLQFQLLDGGTKMFEIFATSILAIWVIIILFFTCELGDRMTYRFDNFGEELNRYDWYKRPIKMQRLYLLFLMDIEQSKHIKCGSISCTRETFRRITWSGFSYFMAFRLLEK